jgi:hypothetical protein
MPTITIPAKVEITTDLTNHIIRLIPLDAKAKEVLDAWYAAENAKTTVAQAQEDAGRSGFADTSAPYYLLKLTIS